MASEELDEKAIFNVARQIDSPESRREYLRQICGADNSLLGRVETLLHAYEEQASFLESSPVAGVSPTLDQPITEKPGAQIGPYKLLQQVGEGGMGVVYMAEQKEPVKRRVALKIIKPGMDTRQVIARFEAERQALAMMDHPNIAKVLDAGQTESGRPYFVMELVNGISVTKYCDEQHLTPRERLELFVPICQAVQHAHHKGIIHRDLKPSNILVALYDGRAVPKIIDFGVAKATSQTLTEKTMFTRLGQVVGTLEYMSPEQAERNQLDIDTRSDIYSLGVVLYELLVGDTPFDRQRLRSAAFEEMLRIIREEEPPKPSTKISSSAALPSIAANRHVDPQKLTSAVRGELDWIVMKAMEKDRNRRYESARAFADDVERHLNDEPVQACPPSVAYRFKKFARRNKAAFATASIVAVSLLVGTGVATWQAVRATDEAARASEAEVLAKRRFTAEKRARQEAENATALAIAINTFLTEDLLGQADVANQPAGEEARDPNVKVKTLLDRASQTVAKRFAEKPVIEGWIRKTIAGAYRALGLYEEAELQLKRAYELLRASLGEEHVRALQVKSDLGNLYDDQGRYAEAEELLMAVFQSTRRLLGPEHNDTLASQNDLAQLFVNQGRYVEAEALYETARRGYQRLLGPEHPSTLTVLGGLAQCYHYQGRFDEAKKLYEVTLKARQRALGLDHPETFALQNNLANLFQDQGRYGDAEKLHKATLKSKQRLLGPEHLGTLSSQMNLARLCMSQGRYGEAEALYEIAYKGYEQSLSPEHPSALTAQSGLALCYHYQGRFDEARRLYEATLKARQRVLGPDHPQTLRVQNNLAAIYLAQGRHEDAEKLHKAVLEIKHEVFGREHPSTLTSQHNLAQVYVEQDRFDEAESLFVATLKARQRALGPEHPATLASQVNLGHVYCVSARYEEAEALLKAGLEAAQGSLGLEHPHTLKIQHNLGWAHFEQGRYDEANSLYETALAGQQRVLGSDHPDTLGTAGQLAEVYMVQGRYTEAMGLLETILEAYDRRHERNTSTGLGVAQVLAFAKIELGHTADALSLLKRITDPKLPQSDTLRYRLRDLAYCHLMLDQQTEYRHVCRRMLQTYRDPPNPETPWTCALHKNSVDDWGPVVDHARRVIAQDAKLFPRLVLGSVLWRAEETKESIVLLRRVAEDVEDAPEAATFSPAYAWFVLAMACQQDGDAEAAKQWFEKADRWTTKVLRQHESANGPKLPWNRRLTLHRLRDEALVLLDINAVDPTTECPTGENSP